MNEKMLAELLTELQHAQTEALGLFTQALCQQVDAKRLRRDLESITKAYTQMPGNNPLALKFLQGAMASALAQQMLQAKPQGGEPHPTPGD